MNANSNLPKWYWDEVKSCPNCLRLKMIGLEPTICQEHIDKQRRL